MKLPLALGKLFDRLWHSPTISGLPVRVSRCGELPVRTRDAR